MTTQPPDRRYVFGEADRDNLELVREIVLNRLRASPDWHQMESKPDGFSPMLTFATPPDRLHFNELQGEVMWELIVQGIISPGWRENWGLPWFHLTRYGGQVLADRRFLPHDPAGYLDDVREAVPAIDHATMAYLQESLECFVHGCLVAATLLLGVSAEAALLALCRTLTASEQVRNGQKLDDRKDLKSKHRCLVKAYESLQPDQKRLLPESLDQSLSSLGDVIRLQRNDLGHPREEPPVVERDAALLYLRLFPGYLRDLKAFENYALSSGLSL